MEPCLCVAHIVGSSCVPTVGSLRNKNDRLGWNFRRHTLEKYIQPWDLIYWYLNLGFDTQNTIQTL